MSLQMSTCVQICMHMYVSLCVREGFFADSPKAWADDTAVERSRMLLAWGLWPARAGPCGWPARTRPYSPSHRLSLVEPNTTNSPSRAPLSSPSY